ncbi:MAG: fumarate reductase subunit FrdD [Candidatus Binataceae bacterium]|jgi:fumarate reductase subunit D
MAAHSRSHRPLVWLLFGTGGFLVAFFFPIHILLSGILQPLGVLPDPGQASLLALLENPLTRLYLAVLLIFAFWHAAYRLRDTICDAFAVRQIDLIVVSLCYGAAAVATVATVVLLICVP